MRAILVFAVMFAPSPPTKTSPIAPLTEESMVGVYEAGLFYVALCKHGYYEAWTKRDGMSPDESYIESMVWQGEWIYGHGELTIREWQKGGSRENATCFVIKAKSHRNGMTCECTFHNGLWKKIR